MAPRRGPLTVQIETKLHNQIKALAYMTGYTMREIIEDALRIQVQNLCKDNDLLKDAVNKIVEIQT